MSFEGLEFESRKENTKKKTTPFASWHFCAMDVRTCPTGNFRHAEVSEALGATGEVFQIDDLLDFSNDDVLALIDGCDEENASEETSPSASLDGNYSPENDNNQVADMPLGGELCVPMDSLADLEWLSNFVEDSFSVAGLGELPSCAFLSVDGKTERKVSSFDDDCNDENKAKKQRNCERNNNSLSSCNFSQWIPVRARRSKRSRTGGRVWTSCPLLPSNPGFESHSSIFTSANQSSDSSSNNSSVTSYSSSFSRPPPAKKHKANNNHSHAVKKTQDVVAAGGQTRRCSHCLVQKTPQWRAGPLGPKTLCNACGVRFKSGRLLPEYRPAVSPTFHNEVHSNSHRKVLELRRQKEEEHKIFHLPQNVSEAEFFVKKEALYLKEMIFEQKNQQHMYGGEISVKKESPYPPKEMMISEQQKNQQHISGGEISVKKESPYPPKEMLLLKQENQHISEGAIFVKQESVISVKEEQQSGGI